MGETRSQGGLLRSLNCLPAEPQEVVYFPSGWGSSGDRHFVVGGGWRWGEARGRGALTLVLGTHCKTDSWSCGCRLEKGGLSRTQEFSEGGLSEGHFLLEL